MDVVQMPIVFFVWDVLRLMDQSYRNGPGLILISLIYSFDQNLSYVCFQLLQMNTLDYSSSGLPKASAAFRCRVTTGVFCSQLFYQQCYCIVLVICNVD